MTSKLDFKKKLENIRRKIKENPSHFCGLKNQVEFSPMNWKKTGPFNRGGGGTSYYPPSVN